jgi:hypothetical protein
MNLIYQSKKYWYFKISILVITVEKVTTSAGIVICQPDLAAVFEAAR